MTHTNMNTLEALTDLDRAVDAEAYWLEDGEHDYARYCTGTDSHGDGESAWFCMSCGALAEDESEPCACQCEEEC